MWIHLYVLVGMCVHACVCMCTCMCVLFLFSDRVSSLVLS